MITMTLGEIADIVGGTLTGGAQADTPVYSSVEFDSRSLTPGGLFLALPGARVDGHEFAAAAIEKGAVAVLAAREVDAPAIVVPSVVVEDSNADIYVHDPNGHGAAVVAALSKLARNVVDVCVAGFQLNVVALTGSAGKTSTKDFIATILSQDGPTVAPPGSFNNELGLPHTVLRCTADTKYLVAEMSARGIGHIKHLTEIAPPKIAAVLNVGSAHLGEFGSRDNIAQAKGEIIEALPAANAGGVAVLNADDPFVAQMASRTQARVVWFSTNAPTKAPANGSPVHNPDYWASDISLDAVARASFTLNTKDGSWPVTLQVFGQHQVANALAAAAIAVEAGVAPDVVVAGLESHSATSAHRMDVQTRADGVTVINDSYNANPDSMRAGIAALAYTVSGRPDSTGWAVLGQMGELGEDATQAHAELGSELAKYNVSQLITVGENPNCAALAQSAADLGVQTSVVPDVESAVELLGRRIKRDDVVLVKASNADRLWRVAEALHNMAPNLSQSQNPSQSQNQSTTSSSANGDSRRNVEGQ
ncbi:UDP-N-acetylmuramyl pentapeptide synthase [Corynebacterium suranareeae]|uniref:UDP-N-acetylmuramoyl-tripeptide--D-alanyl-D-alanine ligase n=1 Tax=Corynebacterium suranareeae TaxID=2506452 RepID=A0A160PS19_9CORY|nr:UDP-N-acetylmuramoyl-tripeptide--D-alanyl-D-alanine ligase [Corynebacterium suranareeae]BAU96496.1 UDP-N-acetylmuramyl pentapeptide synthase [Corynebacterium suranareeae]